MGLGINVTLLGVFRAAVAAGENVCYNEGTKITWGVSALIYAIIALVLLAGLSAWLVWRNLGLRQSLGKAQAKNQQLREDRAIRQNLQHVLERREAEIRRLRARVTAYENDVHEMETRATDLNMHLFQESGRRILAEKEDGVKRMKMEQLEQQLADVRKQLAAQKAEAREQLEQQSAKMEQEIASRDAEINRLQMLNARRLARKAQADSSGLDQITIDDVLKQ